MQRTGRGTVPVIWTRLGTQPAVVCRSVMRQQRRKGSWHPLLVKLMQFAVGDPKLARKLVKDHPEVLTIPETGYLKGALLEAE